jgi:hypothetical protein
LLHLRHLHLTVLCLALLILQTHGERREKRGERKRGLGQLRQGRRGKVWRGAGQMGPKKDSKYASWFRRKMVLVVIKGRGVCIA